MPFQFQSKGKPKAKAHQRKGPSEILGIDIATTGVKVVRIKKAKDGLTLVGAEVLAPVQLSVEADDSAKLPLPKNLLSNYAALTVSGVNAAVRILTLPSHANTANLDEDELREHVGLAAEYRLAYALTAGGRGKGEAKVLVVGLPENEARAVVSLVAVGAPAPFSIEVSGLAALTAFLKGPGAEYRQQAVGVVESGARVTFMALFNRSTLALVRKFDFGTDSLVGKVQQQLGVDRETAEGIISDGSFDISQPVHEVMDPFLRQLSISRDFVERREDCRVESVYLSGGTSLSRYWMNEIANATGIEVRTWNPFESLHLAPDAYPANLQGQETRFAAAVGACLGVLDET